MFALKYNFKLIFKDKLFILLLLTVMTYITYRAVFVYGNTISGSGCIGASLYDTMDYAYFYVVIFLWGTMEFVSKYVRNNLMETLVYKPFTYSYRPLIGMLGINIMMCMYIVGLHVLYSMKFPNFDANFVIMIIERVFLSYFLAGSIGIAIGALLGRLKKRKISIVLTVIIIFMLGPTVHNTVAIVDTDVSILNFFQFINIIHNDINEYNASYLGWGADSYKIVKNVAILSVLMIGVWILFVRKYVKVMVPIFATIFFIGMVNYFMPHPKVGMIASENKMFQYYDETGKMKNERVTFNIEEYSIEIKTGENMKVECKMKLSDGTLPNYKFTLYHTLNVKSVRDENGKELEYARENDYIEIYNSGTIKEIRIVYEGVLDTYIASNSCVFLEGEVPYYPIPGYHEIFEGYFFVRIENIPKSKFNVKVGSPVKLYSNLNRVGDNEFSGEAHSVLLCGGYLEDIEIKGITFVYPKYSNWYKDNLTEENLEKIADLLYRCENVGYDMSGKLVLIHEYYVEGMDYNSYIAQDYVLLQTAIYRGVEKFVEKYEKDMER